MPDEVVVTLDAVKDAMGPDADEFVEVMDIVQWLIDSPEEVHGPKAAIYATKLAALRTKISMKGQYYKSLKTGDPAKNRIRKDVLLAMYASLEENINTLKLMARLDAETAYGR